MNSVFDSAFDPTRWEHWLLIASFLGLAVYGLWLSWQWRRTAKRRRRTTLTRRLAMEVYARQSSGRLAQKPSESAFSEPGECAWNAREKTQVAYPSSAQHLRRHLN